MNNLKKNSIISSEILLSIIIFPKNQKRNLKIILFLKKNFYYRYILKIYNKPKIKNHVNWSN